MTGTQQKSLWGKKLFIDPDDVTIARTAHAVGGKDKPMVVLPPGGPDVVAVFEDFMNADTGMLGLDGENGWQKLGDTGGTITFPSTTNGIARLTVTGNGTAAPASLTQLSHQLRWKMHQGGGDTKGAKVPLRFGARVKLSNYTDTGSRMNVFIGLTDIATAQHPIHDTGSAGVAGDSAAADAVGIIFGSQGDTGWTAVAVNGNTDATRVHLTATQTNNVYQTLEMELRSGISDTGGTAHFFVDGVRLGSIPAPVTGTVALTPTISVFSADTGGAQIVDVDWISVSGPRDTGE